MKINYQKIYKFSNKKLKTLDKQWRERPDYQEMQSQIKNYYWQANQEKMFYKVGIHEIEKITWIEVIETIRNYGKVKELIEKKKPDEQERELSEYKIYIILKSHEYPRYIAIAPREKDYYEKIFQVLYNYEFFTYFNNEGQIMPYDKVNELRDIKEGIKLFKIQEITNTRKKIKTIKDVKKIINKELVISENVTDLILIKKKETYSIPIKIVNTKYIYEIYVDGKKQELITNPEISYNRIMNVGVHIIKKIDEKGNYSEEKLEKILEKQQIKNLIKLEKKLKKKVSKEEIEKEIIEKGCEIEEEIKTIKMYKYGYFNYNYEYFTSYFPENGLKEIAEVAKKIAKRIAKINKKLKKIFKIKNLKNETGIEIITVKIIKAKLKEKLVQQGIIEQKEEIEIEINIKMTKVNLYEAKTRVIYMDDEGYYYKKSVEGESSFKIKYYKYNQEEEKWGIAQEEYEYEEAYLKEEKARLEKIRDYLIRENKEK